MTRGAGNDRLEVGQAGATVIARGTRVEGQVTGKRPVRVEGVLKGNLFLEAAVEIAEGAQVEGDVSGTVIRIAGGIVGNVTATQLVELQAGAAVTGDLAAPAFHVVEGAHLDGHVHMTKAAPSA